jgi:hypothetical protein
MPRTVKLHNPDEYRGYEINNKYTYDKRQLNKIIDALEYYKTLAIATGDEYVVFDVTLNVDVSMLSTEDLDDVMLDQRLIRFNPNQFKDVLSDDKYYYRWTREFKTDYGAGSHYHLMIIANNLNVTDRIELQRQLETLIGVRSSFVAKRTNQDSPYHHLANELDDAVLRHCYRAKLDQKVDGDIRSFDGCRKLKPLLPSSKYRIVKQHEPTIPPVAA